MATDAAPTFGALLRRFRLAAGLSQEALAERAGVSARAVSDLERGQRQAPYPHTVHQLARALRLSAAERARLEDARWRQAEEPRSRGAEERRSRGEPATQSSPPTNLPASVTSFVGRERELAEVRRLLATTRLLTLTGAGGVGKTRLALAVARAAQADYRDGVWLVELAALADPALVPRTAARALGIQEQPGQPLLETLVVACQVRRLLLLLDNCEHLLDAGAGLADALLRGCPGVGLLATSREALGIAGEVSWRVPSLALPDLERLPLVAHLTRYEAVHLFVDRATAALPGFTLTEANAPAVAQLCVRLDGIPLALELAAARVRGLPPEQLAARLDQRFRLLTGGSRTAPLRQQTLRATLDWSHGLLTEAERALLRRLAVFAGGWTITAAEAVCAGDGTEAIDVLDLLLRLVDKSLVVVDARAGEPRYRLLETVRQYAWEKLREAGEEQAVRDRHRDWCLALAEEADGKIRGFEQVAWLTRLEREHDNVRAALAWWLRGDRGPEVGLRLTGALAWFWRLRGHLSEGRRWLDLALARAAGTSGSARTRALNGAGFLAFAQNDLGAATALFEESLRLARERGDQSAMAWALHGLGRLEHQQGNYAGARRVLEESLASFRDHRDTAGSAYSLYFLARVAQAIGDYERATTLYDEALSAAREARDTWSIAWALMYRGSLALIQGDVEHAAELYRESLMLQDEVQAIWGIADCLWRLAVIARLRGRPERAARLFGAEQVLFAKLGIATERFTWPSDHPDMAERQRGMSAARRALGEARFTALVAEGARDDPGRGGRRGAGGRG